MMKLFNLNFIKEYGGEGFIWALFIASMVYLICTEKKKHIRLIVIWVSVVGLLLFMCPFSYKIFDMALDGITYYRFLWAIPVGLIIAFGGTKAFLKHRIVGLLLCGGLIIFTGKKVYQSQYMSISENAYQLPGQMIDICDAIHPEYLEVKACFPLEYIHVVLQYDASIQLAYGREVVMAGMSDVNYFYEAEKQPVLDVEEVTRLCEESQIQFYVVRKDKQTTAPFKDFGWDLYYETDGYYVYRLETVLSAWEVAKGELKKWPEEERNRWLDSKGIPRDVNLD